MPRPGARSIALMVQRTRACGAAACEDLGARQPSSRAGPPSTAPKGTAAAIGGGGGGGGGGARCAAAAAAEALTRTIRSWIPAGASAVTTTTKTAITEQPAPRALGREEHEERGEERWGRGARRRRGPGSAGSAGSSPGSTSSRRSSSSSSSVSGALGGGWPDRGSVGPIISWLNGGGSAAPRLPPAAAAAAAAGRRGISSSSGAAAPPPPPPPPKPGRDYYEVLGVARNASDQDVKRAYYKLAKRYHPDTNAGDAAAAAAFQEVSKAYEALRDPERRRLYDAVGRERMERMEAEGGPGAGAGGGPFGAAGGPFGGPFGGPGGGGGGPFAAADVFEHLFGGGAGADPIFGAFFGGGAGAAVVEAPLRLTFAEAARGTKKWVDVGPGLGGLGGGPDGGGPGPVEVSIPAGVDDGQAVEVTVPLGAPAGRAGQRGGPPPPRALRLRLRVHVAPDPVFRREGANLHVDAALRLGEALLGRALRVPTLDGGAEVFVPPGTMHGDVLRLRGKGLPDPRAGAAGGGRAGAGARGDQYVHVRVAKPQGGLTDRQRELLMQFDAEERAKTQQQGKERQQGGQQKDKEKKAAAA